MLDDKNEPPSNDPNKIADRAPTDPANSGGLRGFNAVGREDSDREVPRAPLSPARLRQTIMLIAAVLILLGIVGSLAFKRSGLSLTPPPDDEHHQFAPPSSGGASDG